MKRYLVFAGADYYPCGGWSDYDSSWNDKEAALNRVKELSSEPYSWAHVVDLDVGLVVE